MEVEPPPQPAAGQDGPAAPASVAQEASDFTAPQSIAAKDMRKVPAIMWDTFGTDMYTTMGLHGVMHTFWSQQRQSSSDAIDTYLLEAAEPVVWQTRTRKKFAVGACVLIPFNKAGLAIVDPDKPPKRPSALHPSLPFCVQTHVDAPALLESKTFVIRSPVAGKVPKESPPPFWAVLEMDDDNANMEVRDITVALPMPNIAIAKVARKAKKKKRDVVVRFPALVNKVDSNAGDLLTYSGSLMDVTADPSGAVDVD